MLKLKAGQKKQSVAIRHVKRVVQPTRLLLAAQLLTTVTLRYMWMFARGVNDASAQVVNRKSKKAPFVIRDSR